jgi:hypothetical protein
VFNVVINGQTALSQFDIVARSGGWSIPVDAAVPVNVTTGQIAIQFVAVTASPQVCAIEIIPGQVAAPQLNSLTPSSATTGSSFPVTLTGSNFTSDVVVNAGPNITVSNVTVVSATQITATFTIPDSVPTATANVTVTTPGGTTPALPLDVTSTTGLTRINAGGLGFIDSVGLFWSADTGFNPNGGGPSATSNLITGASAPGVYQFAHYGNGPGSPQLTYTFTVPNGSYMVNLKVVDAVKSGPGQRVFSVAINGQTVLSNLDLFVQTGQMNQAYDSAFPVSVTNGQVVIQYTTSVLNSKVCGIEIVPASAAPAPSITSISPGSATAGSTVPVTITGTGFANGVTVGAGPKITVKNVVVVNATTVTANFTVAAGTPPGTVNVSVATSGGTATAPFTTQ